MNYIKQIGLVLGIALLFMVFYFKPIFFEGKQLAQHDLKQGVGAGKEVTDYREKTGEEALWTNSMFGGMPMYLVSTKFSGNWIHDINYRIFRFLPSTVDVVFVNFICMFILLLSFRQNVWVSLLGGLLYGFSTFSLLSVEAGHIYKVLAMGYAPLVLAGMNLVFRKKYLLGGSLSALAISLELTSKHYQITFYLIIVALVYLVSLVVFEIKKNGSGSIWKPVLILVGAGILAVGPNVGDVWTTLEYSKVSIRGKKELTPIQSSSSQEVVKSGLDKDYAFAWSQGKWESFTYLIPNLYGGSSQEKLGKDSETYKAVYRATRSKKKSREFAEALPMYWGPQTSTGGPHYASVVIVFFFVLGCFILKKELKVWMLVAFGFTLMIGWGSNFEVLNYFLFDYIPGFNKFRAVAMALTLSVMVMILMGALAFGELFKKGKFTEYKKQLQYAFLATIGLIIVVWGGTHTMSFVSDGDARFEGQMSWILDALEADRVSMLNMGALRSLLFVGLVGLVLWLFSTKTLTKNVATYLILGLALLDVTMVNWKYFGHKDKSYTKKTIVGTFSESLADKEILKDQSLDYRVLDLNNPFNNAITSYYHKSIGGYSGVKMQRYQDLIERQISLEMNGIIGALQNQGKGLDQQFAGSQVLNMLNMKYVIYNPEALPLKNEYANGNAWLVKDVQSVNSADEEMEKLNTSDLRTSAILDVGKFQVSKTEFAGEGKVELVSYEPNNLVYKTNTKSDEFAVFSEVYYDKGWNAYLDGVKVPYVRANYILRAMEIPKGEHEIEFKFEPKAYFVGNKIALVSSILLVLLLLIGVGKSVRDLKTAAN